jgi:hypothetical protein
MLPLLCNQKKNIILLNCNSDKPRYATNLSRVPTVLMLSYILLGITVISTDFKAMGKSAAKLILDNKKEKLKNQFHYIERNTL